MKFDLVSLKPPQANIYSFSQRRNFQELGWAFLMHLHEPAPVTRHGINLRTSDPVWAGRALVAALPTNSGVQAPRTDDTELTPTASRKEVAMALKISVGQYRDSPLHEA